MFIIPNPIDPYFKRNIDPRALQNNENNHNKESLNNLMNDSSLTTLTLLSC